MFLFLSSVVVVVVVWQVVKAEASGSADSSQTSPQSRWPVAECRASLSAQPEANPSDWQSIKGERAATSVHNTNESRVPCGGRMGKHRQIRREHRCVILMKPHRLCRCTYTSCFVIEANLAASITPFDVCSLYGKTQLFAFFTFWIFKPFGSLASLKSVIHVIVPVTTHHKENFNFY